MKPANLLIIMSDEHNRRVLGRHGDPLVQTPNLDALAGRGTRFTDAYTNCPICVPARASFATGRYVHQSRYWDNGHPYDGRVPGWGHRLMADGHRVTSIGKLHYRDSDDPNGFDEELLPMHVLNGVGDTVGLVRRPPPPRPNARLLAEEAGRGESTYTEYDRAITAEACRWMKGEASKHADKPWVLFVSLVCPHFPLRAPEEFFDMYSPDAMPWPIQREAEARPKHPVLEALRGIQNYDDFFRDDDHRRIAIAAYYGTVSFLDDNIGARTNWGKALMFEESVGVPLIMAGPDIPAGQTVSAPVTLVDIYPTAVAAVGGELTPEERATLPGRSLFDVAAGTAPERTPLVEYHAAASITSYFMIRMGKWKYVHYTGYAPQLFDLETDPFEATDLGTDPAYADVVDDCERRLRAVVDPDAATAQAFADQEARIEALGGLDAVSARGNFPYTPAPGEAPKLAQIPGD